jgi:predicted RNase H-like nuclease (RuvC/YqgF family)
MTTSLNRKYLMSENPHKTGISHEQTPQFAVEQSKILHPKTHQISTKRRRPGAQEQYEQVRALEIEVEWLRALTEGQNREIEHLSVEIERLQAEHDEWKTKAHTEAQCRSALQVLGTETAAKIERLRAALQWLMKQPWKSIDKDNMEFRVTVSCYVRDALLAALENKP